MGKHLMLLTLKSIKLTTPQPYVSAYFSGARRNRGPCGARCWKRDISAARVRLCLSGGALLLKPAHAHDQEVCAVHRLCIMLRDGAGNFNSLTDDSIPVECSPFLSNTSYRNLQLSVSMLTVSLSLGRCTPRSRHSVQIRFVAYASAPGQ